MSFPHGPWEKRGADFFESTNYLLIADYYSQFAIIWRMIITKTNATIDVMKQVFSEYGIPKTVMSDRGPQFLSKKFKAFSNQYCFDYMTSSPRYLQSNDMIEQMVKTVKQFLKKCMAAGQDPYLATGQHHTQAAYQHQQSCWMERDTRHYCQQEAWCRMSIGKLWVSRTTRVAVLNTTSQQETYHFYLCNRGSTFKLTLSRTNGLQQPSLRHP